MKQRFVYIHCNRDTEGIITVYGTLKRAHYELKDSPYCLKSFTKMNYQMDSYRSCDIDQKTKLIKEPVY